MTNREKVLVGLMVLAVVFGVYFLFFTGPNDEAAFKSGGDTQLETLKSFITKVADKTKSSLSKEQVYALQKAQSDWRQDPLIHIKPKMSREEEAQHQPLEETASFHRQELPRVVGVEGPVARPPRCAAARR